MEASSQHHTPNFLLWKKTFFLSFCSFFWVHNLNIRDSGITLCGNCGDYMCCLGSNLAPSPTKQAYCRLSFWPINQLSFNHRFSFISWYQFIFKLFKIFLENEMFNHFLNKSLWHWTFNCNMPTKMFLKITFSALYYKHIYSYIHF